MPTEDTHTLERDQLSLERDRLRFERQKLAIELLAKRREIPAAKHLSLRELFSNPLALVIVGGFISVMTTSVSGFYTATENRNTERQKARFARDSAQDALQAELIKKFTEGPRPVVRENLKFLLEAGLLPTYAKQIRAYLDSNPEAAPQAANFGGIQGADDAISVDQLPKADVLLTVARSVGRLKTTTINSCTAFLIAPDRALTANHCIDSNDVGAQLTVDGKVLAVRVVRRVEGMLGEGGYSVLALQGDTRGLLGLRLAMRPPAVGTQLKLVLFRFGSRQLAVQTPNCRVITVLPKALTHGCDTGPGSAGAPILSADGQLVIGIHAGRSIEGTGVGTLASTVSF